MKQMFFVKVVAAVFGGVMVVGCANVNSNRGSAEMTEPMFQPMPSVNAVFNAAGIPHLKYMVGWGFAVEFTSPYEGPLFGVEQTERKIMMTKHLENGQTFNEYVPVDTEEFRRAFSGQGRPGKPAQTQRVCGIFAGL